MSSIMESHSDWRTAQHVKKTDKHCPVGSCGMTESDGSLGDLTKERAGRPQQAHVPILNHSHSPPFLDILKIMPSAIKYVKNTETKLSYFCLLCVTLVYRHHLALSYFSVYHRYYSKQMSILKTSFYFMFLFSSGS